MRQFLFEDLTHTQTEAEIQAARAWDEIEAHSSRYMDEMDAMQMKTMAEDQVNRWYLGGTGRYIGSIEGGLLG